jgi:hypothetical protein
VGSVPANFGAAAAGTPKADEWRSIFTIYLPLALITLSAQYDTPGLASTVENTMDLVCALIAGCKRWMSESRSDYYLASISRYIDGLNRLYPDIQLNSIHHMAFHIFDFLRLFGPVQSWWCFPFERLIGRLQRTTHNHRFGELEATIHRAFVDGGNLRRWLSRPSCPDIIRACKQLFDKVYAPKRDNYTLEQMLTASEDGDAGTLSKVPDDLAPLLETRPTTVLRARLKIDGTIFSRQSTHDGNSHIIFRPTENASDEPVPGSIQYIFLKDGVFTFAVRRYRPLSASIPDPFMKWSGIFRAKLWSADMEPDLVPVNPQRVLSYCVKYQFAEDKIVILRLGKVNNILCLDNSY